MKMKLRKMIVIAVGLGAASAALSQSGSDAGKISGTVFGDIYYVGGHHDSSIEGMNGFWFRRIYLTYDRTIDENLMLRLRFEAASPGDFSSSGKMTPFFKDAYLKFTENDMTYYLGLHGTPTWSTLEKAFGYRPIEKTPLDLFKFGSSRDQGVSVQGKLGSATKYTLMIGNGSGTGGETDAGKTIYLSLDHEVSDSVSVMVYRDYWDKPGRTDRETTQVFLAYKKGGFRAGLLWADQRRQVSGGGNFTVSLWSLYADVRVSDRSKLFVRVDKLNAPVPGAENISYLSLSPDAIPTLYIVGLDMEVRENVRFIPNIEFVTYDGSGVADNVFVRMTFSVKF